MGRVSIDTVFRSARPMSPSHERRSQTRLFKGSFWSFVGEVGDFNRQRNLRGVSPGLGRRGFEIKERDSRVPWPVATPGEGE